MYQQEKKVINYIASINNLDDINKYKKAGITTFLFALKNYSIGYEKAFNIDEINSVNEKKYVLISQILDNNKIDSLKLVIKDLNVDGFIFEDIGLINILKDINKDKILFMNHFNCNYKSINEWLNYVDSVFVSNELTYDEIKEITKNVNKKIILHVFGYNQIMYSKRKLFTNYYDYNNSEPKKKRQDHTKRYGQKTGHHPQSGQSYRNRRYQAQPGCRCRYLLCAWGISR